MLDLNQLLQSVLDVSVRRSVTETLDDLSALVYQKFREVPIDSRWLGLGQIFEHRVSFRSDDIDLREVSEVDDDSELLRSTHHREDFSKLDSFELGPAEDFRVSFLGHRFTKLTAREKED